YWIYFFFSSRRRHTRFKCDWSSDVCSSDLKGPISQFVEKHYKHFNAAALVDAAKGYDTHLAEGGKMMVTLAGAMSTAELGKSLEIGRASCRERVATSGGTYNWNDNRSRSTN